MPPLVLASASARRRELLLQAGYRFEVEPAETDETPLPGEQAVALALRLSQAKAEAAFRMRPEAVTLGADTVVLAPSGELLGKPADSDEAARMLRLLAGATHSVVTGVCVCCAACTEAAANLTYVTFQALSEPEIARYVASGEPMGKAGAYAIQGRAALWTPRILGDYSNVVGLPLALTGSMLAAAGVFPED